MPYRPPANRLLFENEHTRVWEMLVPPGESFPMHSHEHPYLSLAMESPATLILVEEDGTERRLELEAGAVVWGNVSDVHAVRNMGTTVFRNRLVEFKAV